jgi:shikimate dehydrogenase
MSRVLLLGYPVEHSLSPLFQNAALQSVGLSWTYETQQVGADDLVDQVESFRSSDVIGANVTVPHKMATCGLMDSLDRDASVTGAVNTIVARDGQLHGANTDVGGFLTALKESLPDGPIRSGVLILGAGGAARSVAWGLVAGKHADSVAIVSRNVEKGQLLIDAVREGERRLDGSAVHFALCTDAGEIADAQLAGIGLVVNATPIGMGRTGEQTPFPEPDRFANGTFVFDLVYGRKQSRLLEEASRIGLKTTDGLGMLLHQGARSFELWTGMEPPIDVMRKALREGVLEATAMQKRED